MTAGEWLELGRIGSPYGIKGWVHVQSYTDPPERLLDYREWRLSGPGSAAASDRTVEESRPHGAGLVARLAGISERSAAAGLLGAVISVARSRMPPLGAREYYRADLVGLRVMNAEGMALGVVAHFVDTPGGAVMVVRGGLQEYWVPATREHLTRVDLAAGTVAVDWPA